MTNAYYNRSLNPLPTQRVGASDLKNEFQSIEIGFDQVEVEVDAANAAAAAAGASASAAGTSAAAALVSQNASALSAASAAASVVAAAASATSANDSAVAASKLNLGNKATPPTVDNQGAALLAGATYYDTTLNKWRVWTGTEWGDGISALAGVSSINGQTGDVVLSLVSVGDTLTTNRTLSAPSWLLCDGSAYLQSSYAALYAELGLLLNTIGQTKLASPGTLLAAGPSKLAFDTTAAYLAASIGSTPYITVYSRSGMTLTKLSDPGTLPNGPGNGVCVDGAGEFFAVAHTTSPFVTIYQRSGSTLTKLTNPGTLPTGNGQDCACSVAGDFLYVAHFTSPYITAYQRSGTTYTKLTNPAALPSSNGAHISTDSAGTIVAVATGTVVTVYERSGTTLTKLGDITPGGNISGVAVSPSGGHVAITQGTADYVKVYERSGSTFTALKSPTTPTGSGGRPAWSADGRYLCAGAGGPTSLQPCVFQLKGRRLSPATGVLDGNASGAPTCAAFGNGGEFLTVGHSATPFMTTYQNRNYDPSTSFAVPNVAIENGLDTYMRATA